MERPVGAVFTDGNFQIKVVRDSPEEMYVCRNQCFYFSKVLNRCLSKDHIWGSCMHRSDHIEVHFERID